MKKNNLFKHAVYGMTGFLLILFSMIVYKITALPASRPQPLATAKDTIAVINNLDLPCRNLNHQTALMEAARVMDNLGGYLAVVGDLNQSWEDRKRARDQALSLFVDPDKSFIEIIEDYRFPEKKKRYTARSYFDTFLNNYHNSYKLYWNFDYTIAPLKKLKGNYCTEIRFTQLLRKFSAADMVKKYGDLTGKLAEMILVIEETGFCEDLNDKNTTFTQGCCRIKVGNIRALQVEALTDLPS